MTAFLREQVNQLKQRAKSAKTTEDQTPPNPTSVTYPKTVSESHEDALRRWWSTVPPSRRLPNYRIEEIIRLAGLRGRYRENTSGLWVAKALRALGWTTQRNHSEVTGRNGRFWYPPRDTPTG